MNTHVQLLFSTQLSIVVIIILINNQHSQQIDNYRYCILLSKNLTKGKVILCLSTRVDFTELKYDDNA